MSKRQKKRPSHHASAAARVSDSFGSVFPIRAYTQGYLAVLICLCSVFHLNFTLQNPIWSEFDEIANYDYIDKLASGHMPHAEEEISDYSLEITRGWFDFEKPGTYTGTKASMQTAGKSYQAQQPPFYFLVLAPLNFVLKALEVSPPVQIKLLRGMNTVFFAGACILTVMIIGQLGQLLGWDILYGYFLALFSIVFSYEFRAHIGADQLSPLISNVFLYLLLRKWTTGRQEYVAWSLLAGVLAFLTKYTDALFLVIWIVSVLFYYKKNPGLGWKTRLVHFSPLLLLVFYCAMNMMQYGITDPLRTGATKKLFWWVNSTQSPWGVLRYFVYTSFSLEPILHWGNWFIVAVLAVVVFNYVLSFYQVFVEGKRKPLPVFIACQTSLLIIVAALVLNAYRIEVYWFAFRIYSGYTILWLVAVTGTPILLEWKWLRIAAGTAGTVAATVLAWVRA